MDNEDALAARLRELGSHPVDPASSSRHLSAMATVGRGRRRLWTRLKVGAAFGAGLLLGGTGLASAGALPTSAQDVANKTLAKVGVKVPQGTERFNDPAICGTDPATQQPFGNHGQYVKAHQGDPAAAQSRCGKPLKAGQEEAPSDKPAVDPSDPSAGKGNAGKGNGNGNGKAKAEKPDQGKGGDDAADAKNRGTDKPTKPPKPTKPTKPATDTDDKPPAAPGPKATTTTVAPTTSTSTTIP